VFRVRFAPSPTGFLHVGSARTFIFNWLYARRHGSVMVLRVDDTDVQRSTEESLQSIFEGLRWLGLSWDEEYRQSERLELHRQMAEAIFAKGMAYRDFTRAAREDEKPLGAVAIDPAMRELPRAESDRRAAAGEPFALRFRVPRERDEQVRFTDGVYGEQAKALADIEDFALLRSDRMPTYHMASCADDAGLRITDVIRGQDHLSNTFKHILIFQAAGVEPPRFAHLPLLVAPDGTKLSKRQHGPVVSVTTYRDAGFLPQAFLNFLCLLGWSPKDNREVMTLEELTAAFSLEGINRSNAVINFSDAEPFDPKAVWLNAEYVRKLSHDALADLLLPVLREGGLPAGREQVLRVVPLIQERIKLLRDVLTVADFFFQDELAAYDPALLIPQKGDVEMARRVLERAREVLAGAEFTHDGLEQALRGAAKELGVKAGQMFTPVRVAVTGRTAAPPLFETLAVLGREKALKRLEKGLAALPRQGAAAVKETH
jgi:glutamyl-tRNA synthetase